MVKIKAFKLEDSEAANEFMKNNPPFSNEKQSGLILHDGFIVLKYDDGENDDDLSTKTMLTNKLNENNGMILSLKIETELTGRQLEVMKPKSYKETGEQPQYETMKKAYKEDGVPAIDAGSLANTYIGVFTAHFTSLKEIERLANTNVILRDMLKNPKKYAV